MKFHPILSFPKFHCEGFYSSFTNYIGLPVLFSVISDGFLVQDNEEWRYILLFYS